MAGELTPRRIDRAALERIIQRAAELQAGELDTGEGLSEQEVLKLGGEVGIPGRFLRQALYEETTRGGLESAHGALARWLGPRLVGASRVVPGEKTFIEPAIDEWMADTEAMTVKRRLPDRTLWEAQKGFFAEMKRGFGVGGKSYHLARAAEVSVAVTPLEEGYCHVALTADVSNTRGGAITGAGAVAGTGVLLSALLLAVVPAAVPLVLLVPGALGIGIGASIPRAHRRKAARVQLALEQVLDGLERGEIRPRPAMPGPRASAFVRIADEIKKSLVEVADAARQVPPPPKPPTLPRGKD
ncbi:MAG: hypothetical protein ABSB58_04610 [Gemmatimonadales bacterium]|jgi:hypothetical protein